MPTMTTSEVLARLRRMQEDHPQFYRSHLEQLDWTARYVVQLAEDGCTGQSLVRTIQEKFLRVPDGPHGRTRLSWSEATAVIEAAAIRIMDHFAGLLSDE
ncbi:MAG: hypothetical protein ACF8XB_13800 [Planctomycetota bacterium JB042]